MGHPLRNAYMKLTFSSTLLYCPREQCWPDAKNHGMSFIVGLHCSSINFRLRAAKRQYYGFMTSFLIEPL